MDEAKSAEHETMESLTFLDVSCMVIGYYNVFVYIRCDNNDQSTELTFKRICKISESNCFINLLPSESVKVKHCKHFRARLTRINGAGILSPEVIKCRGAVRAGGTVPNNIAENLEHIRC